jgi:hypothetical protein
VEAVSNLVEVTVPEPMGRKRAGGNVVGSAQVPLVFS